MKSTGDVSLLSISWVSIGDDLIRQVAARCLTDEARIRSYLKSDEQDDDFFRAFMFFGVSPINKAPRKHEGAKVVPPISMGCSVSFSSTGVTDCEHTKK